MIFWRSSFSRRMKNMPHKRESIASIMLTASQTVPIPIQKSCGYMQISSESGANVHVPSAKNSEWNAANSPLKSTTAQMPVTTNSAMTMPPANAKGRPMERGPNM